MMDYKVTGIIKRKENIQYEIECQQCKHGYNCIVLIGSDDYGKLVYKGMVNEDEENLERYYSFHKEGAFFKTKEEAYIYKIQKNILYYENKLKEHEKGIEHCKKEIEKEEDTIKMYKEKSK